MKKRISELEKSVKKTEERRHENCKGIDYAQIYKIAKHLNRENDFFKALACKTK